jgi:Tol biopolymer transport system component
MADPMPISSLNSGEHLDSPRHHAPGLAVLGLVLLSACVSSSPSASSPVETASPSAPPSAAASEPPPDLAGRIVFLRTGGRYGDDGTVFTANADGTDERQLSELGEGCCIWATRDGERVLFSTLAPDGRVTTATVNFDGSDRFVVPLPDGTLNLGPGPFSPDGTQIAFEGFEDSPDPLDRGIFIGSADGANPIQITHDFDIPGDWSPDGTQLLVLRDTDGQSPGPDGLFIINVDGSGERQLTSDELVVPCCWGYRWSPDGSRIVFADTNGVLWLISPDGTDLTELFVDDKVAHVRRSAITPTWSPDGTQVLFGLSPTPSAFDPSPNGLYVIDADGTGLTLVIGGNDFKRDPSWVP